VIDVLTPTMVTVIALLTATASSVGGHCLTLVLARLRGSQGVGHGPKALVRAAPGGIRPDNLRIAYPQTQGVAILARGAPAGHHDNRGAA